MGIVCKRKYAGNPKSERLWSNFCGQQNYYHWWLERRIIHANGKYQCTINASSMHHNYIILNGIVETNFAIPKTQNSTLDFVSKSAVSYRFSVQFFPTHCQIYCGPVFFDIVLLMWIQIEMAFSTHFVSCMQVNSYSLDSLQQLNEVCIETARNRFLPILLNDNIYVFGGWNGAPLRSYEWLDFSY